MSQESIHDNEPPPFEGRGSQVSGVPYFALRTVTEPPPKRIYSHSIVIKLGSSPENVPFSEPATTLEERDVSKYDWPTFMNYLFPIHSLASAGTSGDLKVSWGEKSVRGSAATLRSPTSAAITLNSQNIDQAVQHRLKLQTTIEEWNTFFFLFRGLLISQRLKRRPLPNPLSTPTRATSPLPTALSTKL